MIIKGTITVSLILAMLLTALLTHVPIGAQASANNAIVDTASKLMESAFPEVWDIISSTQPNVTKAQASEHGEALSGFPIYVVKWSRSGVSAKVLVAEVGRSPTPVGIEVTINGQASNETMKLVYGLGSKVVSEVRTLYEELAKEALSDKGVDVVGFQIIINGTPVAFIDPTKPSIIPAELSWRIYYVKPILAFSITNDYPLVKTAVNRASSKALRFAIGLDKVKDILSRHGVLRNASSINKYLIIANCTARPAYVIALGPWNTAIVYADNGEYLPSNTRTQGSTTVNPSMSSKESWNFPIPPQYFPYFLSGLAMTVTAIVGIIVIRVATRKK